MQSRIWYHRLCWAAAAGSLFACASQQQQPRQRPLNAAAPRATAPHAASAQTEKVPQRLATADGAIALAVKRELARAGGVPAAHIQVAVDGGVVSLTGEVETGAEALRARDLVENTRGVRAVVDRLRVTGERPESEVEDAVRRAVLALDEQNDSVRVSSKDGELLLRGNVGSLAMRQQIERAARGVYGVKKVENQLRVTPAVSRSDEEIARDVEQRLSDDTYLLGQPVTVVVEGGVVKLSGKVDTAFARRRVLSYASVPGARDISAEALVVSPDHAALTRQHQPPSPARVEQAILHAFELDPRVPDQGIEVQARHGQVLLTGAVATRGQRFAAGEDALDAVGVWMVSNQLVVRPTAPHTDGEVAESVRQRLFAHPYVDARGINVAVSGGVVLLSGYVADRFQSEKAERVAEEVSGVTDVANRLTFGGSEGESGLGRSDAELRQDLLQELWWDSRVDVSLLDVRVEHGTVTVSGQVRSWQERNAVLENVYEVSPPSFVNHVTVQGFPQLARPR